MTTTAPEQRTRGSRAIKAELRDTTLRLVVPNAILQDVVDEARVGGRTLQIAVARLLSWGEHRTNGVAVALPPDDVEVILDVIQVIGRRLVGMGKGQHGRDVLRRLGVLAERLSSQGWTVTESPNGFRIERSA